MHETMRSADDPETMSTSSGSDSDDSDGPDIDLTPEDAQAIMDAEDRLETYPYDYDGHTKYIELLRRCGLKIKLEEARQTMHGLFPLGQHLWLEWLEDADAAYDADNKTLEDMKILYDLAIQDYLSVDIWKQYLTFMGRAIDRHQHRTLRDLFERSIEAGGIHVAQGIQLWSAYIDFEKEVALSEPEGSRARLGAISRVSKLYRRQLGVPLLGNDAAFNAWQAWHNEFAVESQEAIPSEAEVASAYEKSSEMLKIRLDFEAKISPDRPADAELLAGYQAYIDFEKSKGGPARAQYARYLEASLPSIHKVILAVYKRASRNCPWVGFIWERRLRAMQRAIESGYNEPANLLEEHARVYQEACVAGVQTLDELVSIVLARGHLLRQMGRWQALHALFEQAENMFQERFPGQLDYTVSLPAFVAEAMVQTSLEPPDDKVLEKSRAVWEQVLRSAFGRQMAPWAEAISFEVRHGAIQKARSLYKRCHSRRLEDGGQPVLCRAWLNFETLYGLAEDYLAAALKVEPILAEAEAATAAVRAVEPKEVAPAFTREQQLEKRRANDPHYKRKAADAAEEGSSGAHSIKRPKYTEENTSESKQDEQPIVVPSPGKPQVTRHIAFVKHLGNNVGEKEVRELFKDCGPVADVRLGLNPKTKQNKGFAYVEFEAASGLEAACLLDRKEFYGKHIFVAPSDRPAYMKDKEAQEVAIRPRGLGGSRPRREALPHQPTEQGAHTTMKPRLGGMLVPRSTALHRGKVQSSKSADAQHKQDDGANAADAPKTSTSTDNPQDSSQPDAQPRSNADFRAMLLGGA